MTQNRLPGIPHLNKLWQAVNVATELREKTRTRRTYVFNTHGPITFYLRAEKADVRVVRWNLPKVEVSLLLEAAFGWRMVAEQDDAGVYVVAHRRRMLGNFSSAMFSVVLPNDAHLALKLDDGRVTLDHIDGLLEIPPPEGDVYPRLLPAGQKPR